MEEEYPEPLKVEFPTNISGGFLPAQFGKNAPSCPSSPYGSPNSTNKHASAEKNTSPSLIFTEREHQFSRAVSEKITSFKITASKEETTSSPISNECTALPGKDCTYYSTTFNIKDKDLNLSSHELGGLDKTGGENRTAGLRGELEFAEFTNVSLQNSLGKMEKMKKSSQYGEKPSSCASEENNKNPSSSELVVQEPFSI